MVKLVPNQKVIKKTVPHQNIIVKSVPHQKVIEKPVPHQKVLMNKWTVVLQSVSFQQNAF